MDAQLKTKLIEALRSGKYVQGHGLLRDEGDRFCCLGVALDIQGADWDHGAAFLNGFSVSPLSTPDISLLGGIPNDIACHLISMNDGTDGQKRHPFPEIADYIETNIPAD